MNILQLVPEMKVGGVETGTLDLARCLVGEHHKAVVVSGGGPLVEDLLACGAIHYTLPIYKKNIWAMWRMVHCVADIIKKEKIDLVHARSRVPALIGYCAARRMRVPFVTTCHGYYTPGFFSRVMGWGKFVICISESIVDHMKRDFGVCEHTIRLIPRGVDLSRHPFRDKFNTTPPFTIGIVGRITPLKGHDTFFKAMSNVIRLFPYVKIVVAGTAPRAKQDYFQSLVRLTKELKIDSYVEYAGDVRDIPTFMRRLDVLVLATRTPEGFGRVIIEAGANGVPVVATRVGGVVDIIEHNENGLLVQPDQPVQIAQQVLKLLQDRAFAEKIAVNARHKVETQFTLDMLYKKTKEVYREAIQTQRILVIKIGAIGDMILLTPSLRALRKKYPQAYIAVLVGRKAAPIVSRCPYIDEVILFPSSSGMKRFFDLVKLSTYLRRRRFDFSLDFQNNVKTHLLAFLSWIPDRFGHDNGKAGFLLNKKPLHAFGKVVNPVEHQYKLLALLEIYPLDMHLELWPGKQDFKKADELLKQAWVSNTTTLIGVSLSASKRWSTKCWPEEYYFRFCEKAEKEFNARIVLLGSNEDKELAQKFVTRSRGRIISACGKTTLLELAALMKKCNVVVSPDSAPIHIAAAMGVPFVGLFGPTDPRRHVAASVPCKILFKRLKCGPCYKDHCRDIKCMKAISVDEVLEAVGELVKLPDSASEQ